MKNGTYILTIDMGTSAAKATIFSKSFKRVATASRDQTTIRQKPGWAEHDPHLWWKIISSATKEALKKSGIDPQDLAVVGTTAMMHGSVPVDRTGIPLMNCIIWAEVRARAEAAELNEKISQTPSLKGLFIWPYYTAAKIMWIKRHRPKVYQKIHKVLLPKDYIRFKLTERFATDVTDAGGSQMYDPVNKGWNKTLLELMDVPESILPEIKDRQDIAGEVTKKASLETGIPEGTPVIVGGGDGGFVRLGLGEIDVGDAFVYMGTAPAAYVIIDHEVKDPEKVLCREFPGQPGKWMIGGFNGPTSAGMFWYKDQLGDIEVAVAAKEGISVFQVMDREAEKIPPGSDGLILLPHFQGERTPLYTTDAKATMFGLRLGHTRAHIIRAILESVGYAARSVTEIAEKKYGANFSRVRLFGGGSKSKIWRQIMADIFGKPVVIPKEYEASSLGLAYVASVAAGWHDSVEGVASRPNPIVETIQPNKESVKVYQSMFEIYQKLDENMLEIYEMVRKVDLG
ncbi:xylulokinase [Candidatus Bathyarchaeota archaeon]|nr:xylulokinase [Candidatus Bathyarchaeota archaeon]